LYDITITGIGNYVGVVHKYYRIIKQTLLEENITLEENPLTYTGEILYPNVIVKNNNDQILIENEDYTIELPEESIEAGEYRLTINGIGNYDGSFFK